MLTTEFATLESTSNPVEIIVRFIRPVKQETELLGPSDPEPDHESWNENETEALKRRITQKVKEHLRDFHVPEAVTIVCRTHDELLKAIEQAKEAHDLARALSMTGKYAPPANPPTAYQGRCF
jgi:hypothetical protein